MCGGVARCSVWASSFCVVVTHIKWHFSFIFFYKNNLGNASIKNGNMFHGRMSERSHSHFTEVLLSCVNFLCMPLAPPAGEKCWKLEWLWMTSISALVKKYNSNPGDFKLEKGTRKYCESCYNLCNVKFQWVLPMCCGSKPHQITMVTVLCYKHFLFVVNPDLHERKIQWEQQDGEELFYLKSKLQYNFALSLHHCLCFTSALLHCCLL